MQTWRLHKVAYLESVLDSWTWILGNNRWSVKSFVAVKALNDASPPFASSIRQWGFAGSIPWLYCTAVITNSSKVRWATRARDFWSPLPPLYMVYQDVQLTSSAARRCEKSMSSAASKDICHSWVPKQRSIQPWPVNMNDNGENLLLDHRTKVVYEMWEWQQHVLRTIHFLTYQ